MSIIVTQINKHGIVFGSDSNITGIHEVDKEDQKIFEIPSLNAAMCIAGTYTVKGEMMDIWLPNFIKENHEKYKSLREFVELLSKQFEQDMTVSEKALLSISHIAGYVDNHPEMWCLSNTTLLDNGKYSLGQSSFHFSEDLWGRDWNKNNLALLFESDGLNYQIYINSLTQGRVAFNTARKYLDLYFSSMFLSEFKFRYPRNLEEHSLLVRVYIDIIEVMYKISDYEPKEIGGKTQVFFIRKPF